MCILLCIFLIPAAVWGQLPSGPYVTQASGTSATVMWVSEQVAVRYGSDPNNLDATTQAFKVNQVILTGLKPGVTYHYEVPGAGAGSFTMPPNPTGSFKFAVFGDNRTRHDTYRKVAAAIAAAKPTFVVHTGDQVTDGRFAEQWPIFFDISREWLRHTVFFPALGNHERNTAYWYQFYGKTTGYYSFDWGKTHWVILNSDAGNVSLTEEGREAFWKEQIAWMEKDLDANRNAEFRFAAFHHPPYTAVLRRHEEAARIAKRLVPLLKKYKLQAVFSGHDHNYQRHVEDGIQYIVTGGGGAPLYPVDGPLPGLTVKADSIENYVFARAEDGVIMFEARTVDGRVLDRFEIKK